MAFVVRRPKGRFEIRESVHTPAGPRARSLATFTQLDEEALARAEKAATTAFDGDEVRASARRAGAPVTASAADRAAAALLHELSRGRRPSPGLRRLLLDALRGQRAPALEAGDSIGDWVGATAETRGDALKDLLSLTDYLPGPRRQALDYPRLARRD
jgi:hypothetical protein